MRYNSNLSNSTWRGIKYNYNLLSIKRDKKDKSKAFIIQKFWS